MGFRPVWSLFRVSFFLVSCLSGVVSFSCTDHTRVLCVGVGVGLVWVLFCVSLFLVPCLNVLVSSWITVYIKSLFVTVGAWLVQSLLRGCASLFTSVLFECSSVFFRLRTIFGCVFVGDSTVWYVFVCVLVACFIIKRDCTGIEHDCNAKIRHRFGRGAWREEGEKNRARVGQIMTTRCLPVSVSVCSQLGITCANCSAHVCCSVHFVGLLRARGSPSFFLSRASVCVGRASQAYSDANQLFVSVATLSCTACHTYFHD